MESRQAKLVQVRNIWSYSWKKRSSWRMGVEMEESRRVLGREEIEEIGKRDYEIVKWCQIWIKQWADKTLRTRESVCVSECGMWYSFPPNWQVNNLLKHKRLLSKKIQWGLLHFNASGISFYFYWICYFMLMSLTR